MYCSFFSQSYFQIGKLNGNLQLLDQIVDSAMESNYFALCSAKDVISHYCEAYLSMLTSLAEENVPQCYMKEGSDGEVEKQMLESDSVFPWFRGQNTEIFSEYQDPKRWLSCIAKKLKKKYSCFLNTSINRVSKYSTFICVLQSILSKLTMG